jgi:hypothetical protein
MPKRTAPRPAGLRRVLGSGSRERWQHGHLRKQWWKSLYFNPFSNSCQKARSLTDYPMFENNFRCHSHTIETYTLLQDRRSNVQAYINNAFRSDFSIANRSYQAES